MKINWFPGHMKKALSMMNEEVKDVDVIIYMLDARAPLSSINPSFLNLIKFKPVVFIINKTDLIDKSLLAPYIEKLKEKENSQVLLLNATVNANKQKIVQTLESAVAERLAYYKEKGAKITLKALIIGVPNCGKSTLANTLAGKVKAETGNRAGVTKAKQWIKVSPYIEVLDTPGTLWPSLTNNFIAENLAFIGSIKDEVLDAEELCFALIKRMKKLDVTGLENRYNITIEEEDKPINVIEKIGLSKGLKVRGGEVDYDRVYKTVITDYRHGKITTKILDMVK